MHHCRCGLEERSCCGLHWRCAYLSRIVPPAQFLCHLRASCITCELCLEISQVYLRPTLCLPFQSSKVLAATVAAACCISHQLRACLVTSRNMENHHSFSAVHIHMLEQIMYVCMTGQHVHTSHTDAPPARAAAALYLHHRHL